MGILEEGSRTLPVSSPAGTEHRRTAPTSFPTRALLSTNPGCISFELPVILQVGKLSASKPCIIRFATLHGAVKM